MGDNSSDITSKKNSPAQNQPVVEKPKTVETTEKEKTPHSQVSKSKQDGVAKPSTSRGGSTTRPSTSGTSKSRPRGSSTTSSRVSTSSTASKDAADVLTKALDIFNQLSSSISDISVRLHDLESKKRKHGGHDGPADKRRRTHIVSDDSEEDCDSDNEQYNDSGDEVFDQIDQLINADTVSTEKNKSDPSDQWLDSLAQEFINEEVRSPPISDKLSGLLNGILSKRISDDKIKQKLEVYPAPQNVDGLTTPKVNPEVWGKLKADTRSRDVRMQKAQVRVTRGLSALAMLAEKITQAQVAKEPVDLHEALKLTLNSFALIANGNMEVSLRRREFIRPDLNFSYRELCSPATPITDLLFGDELARVVKDINETNRMSSRFTGFSNRGSHRGGYGYKNKNNNSRDFKKQNYPPKNGGNSHFKKGKRGGGANQQNRR